MGGGGVLRDILNPKYLRMKEWKNLFDEWLNEKFNEWRNLLHNLLDKWTHEFGAYQAAHVLGQVTIVS